MPGRFKKLFLLVAMTFVCAVSAWAQKINLEVNAPPLVSVGEAFRIEFSVNGEPQEFIAPAFSGFDIVAGPTTSHGKQISIVNRTVTQSVDYAYTYVLLAKSEGKFTIPAAQVKIDGKTYASQPTIVEVVNADAMNNIQNNPTAAASVAEDDLLVRVIVNRNTVYKGQPVKVTFKLYSRLPRLQGLQNVKYPAFNGFWVQDLDISGYQPRRETYNNKVYETHILKESLLFPQQSGDIFIEQFGVTVVGQIVTQNARQGQSVFDDIFGGGQTMHNVTRSLSASPVRITVKDHPAGAPANFNGAVGKFQMTGGLEKNSLSANSSDTYTIKISGAGNLSLIQAPKISMPASFEQYNMKSSTTVSDHTASGSSGYLQFEYPFIPRGEGEYTIDPVEFSYFDPESGKYVTLHTAAQAVTVTPDTTGSSQSRGVVSGIGKEDLKILDKDIRFIRTGDPRLQVCGSLFFGSLSYYLMLGVLIILFLGLYKFLKRYFTEQNNTVLVRNKKANKVALARLRAAQKAMTEGSKDRFYEEMLKALWGYMSDKLNIPVSNLTKDNIREELARREIPQEAINRFIDIISECEYAQYSPSSSGQMTEIYNSAASMLSKFESLIKK